MDYEGGEDSQQKISKFNAAALINLTLSDLWKEAYAASKKAQFQQWNSVLNCIWMELGGDVAEGKEDDQKFNTLNKQITEAGGLIGLKPHSFNQQDNGKMIKMTAIYNILLQKSLFLKRLQYKQGKGTAYEDGSDAYMDN